MSIRWAEANDVSLSDAEGIPLFAPTKKVYPQSVRGPFRRAKWIILGVCLTIYYLLPFVRWDRGPNLPNQAVLVDLANGRFYFFFIELWPQEAYYFTGLLILAAFILFLMNAIAGRVWCGYLCPQTVWTDLFLAVERVFEGDRRARIKLDDARWSADKALRKTAKHSVWLLIAWWTGGAWVLYFADAPTLVRDLSTGRAPFTAYMWIAILTVTTYALAGILREQVCLYMCPWPRIQAALTDNDAANVTYRYDRGEPRVSLKEAKRLEASGLPAGDCIDCNQCVAVCPTGVDIREGSQLGCIQCGLCIDACDTVMAKIDRPPRLIAYDTDDNVRRRMQKLPEVFKPLRARTAIYAFLIAGVGGAMLFQLATRATATLSVLHERNPLYVTLRDGSIRNAYIIRVANKRPDARPFALSVVGPAGAEIEAVGVPTTADARTIVTVGPDTTNEFRVLVTAPRGAQLARTQDIVITAADLFAGEVIRVRDNFFAP
jgi:cytochrome c oxidase accessory protein FixG